MYEPDGKLIEANDAFLALSRNVAKLRFDQLFGCTLQQVATGDGAAAECEGKRLAIAASPHDGSWLVQANDLSALFNGYKVGEEEARRDPLTGLLTRSHLLPELGRLSERGGAASVLMIDLDRFKAVNDTLAHGVGDELLVKVGERPRAAVRPTDLLARMGGDEFVILQFGGEQPAGAESLAKRVVELVGRPYIVNGHMIDIGASVGITIAEDGNPEQLLKQADIALYRAKQGGRGRYTFFEQRMDDEMQERRMMEIDLRRAVAFRQFELHYQPQFCLASRRVSGMEALIRWQHPTRGLVAPSMFVPLAEETSLIIPSASGSSARPAKMRQAGTASSTSR